MSLIETATEEMSRSLTAQNSYQGAYRRVLCVCSAGLLRSPTLAWVLSNAPYNCNVRAAGSHPEYALVKADQVLLNWAQCVVFANPENYIRLSASGLKLPKNVYTLDIPDSFAFREPGLVKIIKAELKAKGFPEGK